MVELGFEPTYLSALSAVFHFSLAIACGVSEFIIPIRVTDEAQRGEDSGPGTQEEVGKAGSESGSRFQPLSLSHSYTASLRDAGPV